MSRLSRYTQQIFGSQAGANQIAEYGSFAAGSPQTYSGTTITPALVQAIGNYLSGWFSAVEGAYSPAIEDMNALCYLFAYQLSYILNVGLPEWDSGTTYYAGQLAQDGTGVIYASLTNSNLNNALTDGSAWFAFPQAGSLTNNTFPYSGTTNLPTGQTLFWPNLTIGNGQTMVVPSNANFYGMGKLQASGTGVIQATGTGVIRVY